MIKKKIALFANDYVGLEICKFLRASGDKIVKLYVHDLDKQKFVPEIIQASGCLKKDVVGATETNSPEKIAELEIAQPDFIITVYWAYLLKPKVFKIAKQGTINFHPAPLPINRGWYPHVHSILDGSPTGVTLHTLAEDADTGLIWAQKLVPLSSVDTAGDIYKRLQEAIIQLFKDNWEKIKNDQIKPTLQDKNKKGNYHKKSEIESLDQIDMDQTLKAKDLINKLRARTFGKKGFAYFLDNNGEKIYVQIRLNKLPDFE
ncbi:MAG: hypothetical protein A3J53_02110 [Candidatus Harrisonbacteria bacterium RIFCSPHIGHO2_02_FULL_40_20]|nr:MAG: hypothetical protein A3J53_02110 [Candidatus Harrisonbacteria bacterium RIFCSPHIGHO2_02_FULL_40_20]